MRAPAVGINHTIHRCRQYAELCSYPWKFPIKQDDEENDPHSTSQQAHPSWFAGVGLILTSITIFGISTVPNLLPSDDLLWFPAAAAPSAPSIPGKAWAILLNKFLTLCPTFALVSINIRLFFFASSSPCCVVTSLLSFRSVLLPTRTMITSFPLSPLTSSTHFRVFWKDFASVRLLGHALKEANMPYLKYHRPPQPRWNLECMMESDFGTVLDPPCPIVVTAPFDLPDTWSAQTCQQNRSWSRIPLTFERKSMPIVAWYMLSKESYINRVIRDVLPTACTHQ